jgi:8-oxo-dGTP diphosphatase
MKEATLCIPMDVSKQRILLGMKKIGFGKDKYNGFGGKIEAKETILEATIRELDEECGLIASPVNLFLLGKSVFLFPFKPEWDQIVYPSIVTDWEGTPKESNEMKPEWFSLRNHLPSDRMWEDDQYWLPYVLRGMYVTGCFIFAENDGTTILTAKALNINTEKLVQF